MDAPSNLGRIGESPAEYTLQLPPLHLDPWEVRGAANVYIRPLPIKPDPPAGLLLGLELLSRQRRGADRCLGTWHQQASSNGGVVASGTLPKRLSTAKLFRGYRQKPFPEALGRGVARERPAG